MNKLVFLRVLIGIFFAFSGFEKLMQPVENFQYVVESYKMLNHTLSLVVALIMPWVELLLGVFVVLGLWLKTSLKLLCLMTAGFIVVVAQAILRSLPIDECGCFGESISLPLHVVLLMDSVICILIAILVKFSTKISIPGLDDYFSRKS